MSVSKASETFELIVEAGFRLPDPESPGDRARCPVRWKATGGALKVVGASIGLIRQGASLTPLGLTDRDGRLLTPLLADGLWTLRVDPEPRELSPGPATAMAQERHWLSGPKSKSRPKTRIYEAEYQPLTITLEIEGGIVRTANVCSPTPTARPVPAVLFWRGVGEHCGHQALHIDWKPDFIRRVRPELRPLQRRRTAKIDLIVVHQTGGNSIGGAFNTFLAPSKRSGVHFINDIDGHVIRLADDHCFTQHGGGYADIRQPVFAGGQINDRAIGIENVHKGKGPFPDAQYRTLIDLILALRTTHGIPPQHVIGHQDATPKANCPGSGFDWPRLEVAGAALAPLVLSVSEIETMFSGFFAGTEGKRRSLTYSDLEQKTRGGFRVTRGEKVLAEALKLGPIDGLRQALATLGYAPAQPIMETVGQTDNSKKKYRLTHKPGHFDKPLAFCLAQFVRHFATGARYRSDQKAAYVEIALGNQERHNRVVLDLALAQLLRGAELAVRAAAVE